MGYPRYCHTKMGILPKALAVWLLSSSSFYTSACQQSFFAYFFQFVRCAFYLGESVRRGFHFLCHFTSVFCYTCNQYIDGQIHSSCTGYSSSKTSTSVLGFDLSHSPLSISSMHPKLSSTITPAAVRPSRIIFPE